MPGPININPASSLLHSFGKPMSKTTPVSSIAKLTDKPITSIGAADRAAASTSITHAGGTPVGGVTSVSHIGETTSRATTSINHSPLQGQNGDEPNQQEADDRRYNFMQRMIRARKAKEASGPDVYDLNLKTGGGFRSTGASSVRRKLSRLYSQAPATYKNLNVKDRQYFANLVKEHAKKVSTGVGFGKAVRSKIGRQLEKDKQAGVISKYDKADFKKIIGDMKP